MKRNTITMNIKALLTIILALNLVSIGEAKDRSPRKGTPAYYSQGVNKEWREIDYKKYNQWLESIGRSSNRSFEDDQVLKRQWAIINGNKITSEIWNYGSISSPGNRITDIVWEGLGYGYEFGPIVCAEVEVTPRSHQDAYVKLDNSGNPVVDANGDTVWCARVISEGLVSYPETSPDNNEIWGWDPLAYSDLLVPYADTESDHIPTSSDVDRDGDGKPDSWPEGWYNVNNQEYQWPGALRQGSSNADLEAFFVVDDRNNKEFEYYPFSSDSSRRGLGIEIECRYYQWSNPLAEDIIFLIYKVTNKSEKNLNDVIFGMWGDPHIGGPSNWSDDLSFFDQNINMVYAWDEDNLSDIAGKTPGYFGYKFLESPGDPYDGIDNDGDGMTDESRSNGEDDDGDWDPEKHDVGEDGIPNTGDTGEGDGQPTPGDPFDIRIPGEPNFEWTDLDEADMVGLTGFKAPPFLSQNAARNDDYFYNNFLIPGEFDTSNSTVSGDYIFLYSSGPFTFPAGEARRFSIALLVGQDQEDLTLNAITAQDIYEKNYEFAKPPAKPNVVAVPGDEKVTLYWDAVAEESIDPLSQEQDFEGYVIYRSTDPQFLDQQTITDANGSRFLFEPLKTTTGASAKFDLVNEYEGLSTIPFANRGVFYHLGNNTGLVHSFVDSNQVINGQEYYYAVVSYDHGDDSLQIAPVECSKRITVDPERNETLYDVNTIKIVPRSRSAGFVSGVVTNDAILHTAGVATGDISLEVIDHRALEDDNSFRISFQENPTRYSVLDLKTIETEITIRHGQYVNLPDTYIYDSSFVLIAPNGSVVPDSNYTLNIVTGKVLGDSTLIDQAVYTAQYQYFGVYESTVFENDDTKDEEIHPVFDGLKIYVSDESLNLDEDNTVWNTTSNTSLEGAVKPFNNVVSKKYPADYEVRFFDSVMDSSAFPGQGYIKSNFQVWEVTEGTIPEKRQVILLELAASRDSLWTPGERVIILQDSTTSSSSWEFTFTHAAGVDTVMPGEGDIFYIATTRPFTVDDEYEFETDASYIDNSLATNDLDKIAVVPNPYVVTNAIERANIQDRNDRGPRRMYFNHLPRECTIRIYTMSGELVKTLHHSAAMDDGKEYWDLTTKDNFPVAYGVYVYHVDAGELGEKIGRFGVIK